MTVTRKVPPLARALWTLGSLVVLGPALVLPGARADVLDEDIRRALPYPLESAMDRLETLWPAPEGALDPLLEALAELPDQLGNTYGDALRTHHAYNPEHWSRERTPQQLARRGASIVAPKDPHLALQDRAAIQYPNSRVWMPRLPNYFGVQCLTPIPGRPATWSDFIVVRRFAPRLHAARYDERNELREFVLMIWSDLEWRALACAWYPDGVLERIALWDGGGRLARRLTWDPEGAPRDEYHAGGVETPRRTVTCTVEVSLLPPGEAQADRPTPHSLLAAPLAGVYVLPAGVPATITAPPLARHDFAGWSGDVSGAHDQLTIQPDRDLRLTAHYRLSRLGDGKLWIDPLLRVALHDATGIPDTAITASDLDAITSIDLSASRFDRLEDLRALRYLKHANLGGRPIGTLYSLSPHAAFESALKVSTWPGNPVLLNKVLLALHTGFAPPLNSLVLNGSKVYNANSLAFLAGIVHLEMRDTGITSIRFVEALPLLESLDIRENEVTSIASLAGASPYLKRVRAEKNKIQDVSEALAHPNWPDGATIALEGNPLSARALREDIPALSARGVAVTRDLPPEDPILPRDDQDADGDGYSDLEEWTFVSLFTANEAERRERYADAIADAETPASYLALAPNAGPDASGKVPLSVIPTTDIFLNVKGQGNVYPGPGKHTFARMVFNEDRTWNYHTVTLTPEPEPGWELIPLNDSYFDADLVARSEAGNGLTLKLQSSCNLHFEFRPLRSPLSIDLVDALTKFVETYYPEENPLQFDRNSIAYSTKNGDSPKPNGMPDAAEFRLLQGILERPDYGRGGRRGTSFDEAMTIWNANLEVSRRALGDLADEEPFLAHVMCAYATAGGSKERSAFLIMLQELRGITIERNLFHDGLGFYLRPTESIHMRAKRNNTLWAQVTAGREVDRVVLDAYADLVLSQPAN